MKRCLVLGCNSSHENDSNAVFFAFPINKNSKRYKQWVAFTQNPEARSLLEPKYICAKHFDEGTLVDEQNLKLIYSRVPTLYPPIEDNNGFEDHVYSLPPLPDSPVALFYSPPRENSPLPPPPVLPQSLLSDSENEEVTEVLNEQQSQARIMDLMVNVNTLTKENVKLLKENTAILLRNETLKKEMARWRAYSEAVVLKAGQNSRTDYSRYKKDTNDLKRALAKTEKELTDVQKENSLLKEKLHQFLMEEDGETTLQETLDESMDDEPCYEELDSTEEVDKQENENKIMQEEHCYSTCGPLNSLPVLKKTRIKYRELENIPAKELNKRTCCFIGCSESKAKSPSLHYYYFPVKRPEICDQWVLYCANEAIANLPQETLRWRVVCEKHFNEDDFHNNLKIRLKQDAVPKVFVEMDENERFHLVDARNNYSSVRFTTSAVSLRSTRAASTSYTK